ncbi:MAG TPA: hypothetical protein VHO72_08125 [Bacteroidales bacterium]|nr:hypothetical protein [Bacteroidales bacterium]
MKSILFWFLALTFFACSKETSNEDKIVGKWFNSDTLRELNRISIAQYDFRADNSLEVLRIEHDLNTKEILGYRYRSTGNYKLEGQQLSFSLQKSYTNDDALRSYSSIEDLKLLDKPVENYMVTCKFGENYKTITFVYPPCGPAENCIGSMTYWRE